MNQEPGDIILVLRPGASAIPLGVRLRQLLKHAGRGLELKCVSVTEVPTAEERREGIRETPA